MATYKLVRKPSKRINESFNRDLKILRSLYKESKLHSTKKNKLIFENAKSEFRKRYGDTALSELKILGFGHDTSGAVDYTPGDDGKFLKANEDNVERFRKAYKKLPIEYLFRDAEDFLYLKVSRYERKNGIDPKSRLADLYQSYISLDPSNPKQAEERANIEQEVRTIMTRGDVCANIARNTKKSRLKPGWFNDRNPSVLTIQAVQASKDAEEALKNVHDVERKMRVSVRNKDDELAKLRRIVKSGKVPVGFANMKEYEKVASEAIEKKYKKELENLAKTKTQLDKVLADANAFNSVASDNGNIRVPSSERKRRKILSRLPKIKTPDVIYGTDSGGLKTISQDPVEVPKPKKPSIFRKIGSAVVGKLKQTPEVVKHGVDAAEKWASEKPRKSTPAVSAASTSEPLYTNPELMKLAAAGTQAHEARKRANDPTNPENQNNNSGKKGKKGKNKNKSESYRYHIAKNKQLREAVFGAGDPFLSFITSHINNFHNLDVSTIIGSICGYAKSAEAQMATSGIFGKILHGLATVLLKGVAIVGTWIAGCIDFIMGTMNVPIYNAYPTFTFGKAFILAALCASVLWVLKKVMGKFTNKNVKEASYLYIEVQNAIAECNVTFDKMKELGESVRLEEAPSKKERRMAQAGVDPSIASGSIRPIDKSSPNKAAPVKPKDSFANTTTKKGTQATTQKKPGKFMSMLNSIIEKVSPFASTVMKTASEKTGSAIEGASSLCGAFISGWTERWNKLFGKNGSIAKTSSGLKENYYIPVKKRIMEGFKNFKEIIGMFAYNVTAPIRKGLIRGKISYSYGKELYKSPLVRKKAEELINSGMSYPEAMDKAIEWVKDKASTSASARRFSNLMDDKVDAVDNQVSTNRDALRKHPWLDRLYSMFGRKGQAQVANEVAYLVNKMTKKGLNLTEAEKINVASILVENKYKKILAKKYGMSLSE